MGVLSGIAGFFGAGEAAAKRKAAVKEEINLLEAIQAHLKWKARLQLYLEGRSAEQLDPAVICRDDQCVLGKWIHGSAREHFHESEKFHELRADHAQFHRIAAKVVENVQAKDRQAALVIFDGDYQHASRQVVNALTDLHEEVNG